jgi:hypothetical protein
VTPISISKKALAFPYRIHILAYSGSPQLSSLCRQLVQPRRWRQLWRSSVDILHCCTLWPYEGPCLDAGVCPRTREDAALFVGSLVSITCSLLILSPQRRLGGRSDGCRCSCAGRACCGEHSGHSLDGIAGSHMSRLKLEYVLCCFSYFSSSGQRCCSGGRRGRH